jgi:hypothetical protein
MLPGTFNVFDFLLLIDLGQMMLLPGVYNYNQLPLRKQKGAPTLLTESSNGLEGTSPLWHSDPICCPASVVHC